MLSIRTWVVALVCGLSSAVLAEFGPELQMLPENSRYLMYHGLPMQGIYFKAGHGARYPDAGVPSGSSLRAQTWNLEWKATYGNYLACHFWHWPDVKTWKEAWDKFIDNDEWWKANRSNLQSADAKDFVYHLMAWHPKINYSNWSGTYSNTDLFYAPTDPRMKEDMGKFGLPGLTRTSIHLKFIENIVKYTWDLPNVAYCFAFEACNFYGACGKGESSKAFQKWWADQLRAKGAASNSKIKHIVSSFQGGYTNICHPSCYGGDFYLADDWHDGFNYDPAKTPSEVWGFKVPMIRMAAAPADDPFPTWPADKKYALLRKQFARAYGTGDWYTHNKLPEEMSNWFQQVRCYVENVQTIENEPGDEVTEAKLPQPAKSSRPSLAGSAGYTNGAKRNGSAVDFSVVYKDADNDPPAITEVWVDRNGDGRFDPTPADGERFVMKPSGTSYSSGVEYAATGIRASFDGTKPLRYVFRFADKNWYPPVAGGVIQTNNKGISYRHWEIGVTGSGTTAIAKNLGFVPGRKTSSIHYDLQGRLAPQKLVRRSETRPGISIYVDQNGISLVNNAHF